MSNRHREQEWQVDVQREGQVAVRGADRKESSEDGWRDRTRSRRPSLTKPFQAEALSDHPIDDDDDCGEYEGADGATQRGTVAK